MGDLFVIVNPSNWKLLKEEEEVRKVEGIEVVLTRVSGAKIHAQKLSAFR